MKRLGFTLVEMLMMLVLLGTLTAIALPRIASLKATQAESARDQVAAALQVAAKTAAGHRRLVCASFDSGNLVLRIASDNPAAACSAVLLSPLGEANRLGSHVGLQISVTPQSTLYFQPSGVVSVDATGATPATFTVSLSSDGDAAPIVSVIGSTGSVL